jgi:hypothetical protein
MLSSSAKVANVPGTGVPSSALWPSVRDVVNPNAPASIASRARRDMASISSALAGALPLAAGPITYRRNGPWAS